MLTNLKNAADRALAKVANRLRGETAITDSVFNNSTPPAVLIEANEESDHDYVLTLLVTQDSEHLLLAPISVGDVEEGDSPVTRLLLMPRDFVLDEHFFESAEAALWWIFINRLDRRPTLLTAARAIADGSTMITNTIKSFQNK